MKILIFGTGAIGGYFGAKLADSGQDVTFVARGATAEAIEEQGLTIAKYKSGTRLDILTVQPPIFPSLRQAYLQDASYDLIMLGMKAYAIESAVNEISAFVSNPPLILTTQNGIGIEDKLIAQFGQGRIIAGSVTVPVSLETRNVLIEEREDCGFGIAPTSNGQDVSGLVGVLENAGISTTQVNDYRSLKWSKALSNMIGNASSAILNRHPSVVYNHDKLFDMEVAMLQEALAVMKKLKIDVTDLPGLPLKRLKFALKRMPRMLLKPLLTNEVTSGRGDKLPSFQLDLNAGKKQSEVLFHNGAVAREGLKVGVPTPVNTVLTTILLNLANGKVSRDNFHGKPEALLNAIEQYKNK
jgi:2-dehydropantoate 2-reductase